MLPDSCPEVVNELERRSAAKAKAESKQTEEPSAEAKVKVKTKSKKQQPAEGLDTTNKWQQTHQQLAEACNLSQVKSQVWWIDLR